MKYNFVSKLIKVAAVPVFLASLAVLPHSGVTDILTNSVDIYADHELIDGTLYLSGTVTSDKDTEGTDVVSDVSFIYNNSDKILNVVALENTKFPEDCSSMFFGCASCVSMDLSKADTGNTKNMESMFMGCQNLEKLDISEFDTSNVLTFMMMFGSCEKLEAVDLSNFNTDSLLNMQAMFADCKSLKSLDLSSFNSSNVRMMQYMFTNCVNLKTLNLSGMTFDLETLGMEISRGIFGGCTSLERVMLTDPQFIQFIPDSTDTYIDGQTQEVKPVGYKNIMVFITKEYSGNVGTKILVSKVNETETKIDDRRSYCFDEKGDVYLIYHTSSLAPESVEVRYVGSETAGNYKMNDILKPTDEKILAEPFTKVYESIKFEDGSELKPAPEGEYIYAIKLTGANALKPVNIDFYENAAPAENGENIKE